MIEFLLKYQPAMIAVMLGIILFCVVTQAMAAPFAILIVLAAHVLQNWESISRAFKSLAGEEDGKRETVEPADDVKAES